MHLRFLLPQQFAGTCRDAGFAALLPRDDFAGCAALLPCFAATARRFLRRARMKSLHRRRFSSALAHDSNLAEGFFVALMAALRCLRSAMALSVAVFFIQRVNKHRSQQTAAGTPPAPHGAPAGVDKANYLSRVCSALLSYAVLCNAKQRDAKSKAKHVRGAKQKQSRGKAKHDKSKSKNKDISKPKQRQSKATQWGRTLSKQ